ncbi:hypothetical protein ACFVAQ_34675 [Streptomyces sp. NPDC057651]|uniref:hypothetical protein n=1 Tax=Streptomyces sp. NPDC057651 TaxID=3346194 RepID=UPI00368D024E
MNTASPGTAAAPGVTPCPCRPQGRRAAAASNQLAVLVMTRLKRMQYRPGLIDGLAAMTGLDFRPL